MRYYLIGILLISLACKQKEARTVVSDPLTHKDTTPIDSVDSYDFDCFDSFMASTEKVKDTLAITVRTRQHDSINLKRLVTEELLSGHTHMGLKDLDGDGKKELIIFSYTGGMHCCDEIYILEEEAPNLFTERVKFFAGNTCVTATNEFTFNSYELFGYFFSCYACLYVDSAKGLVEPPLVSYKYKNGKLVLAGDTISIKNSVINNLELLTSVPIDPLKDDWDESGVRKMYALNFAAWHLLHGNDLKRTKQLFDQYYQFKDKALVWKEFQLHIENLEEQNTFTQ